MQAIYGKPEKKGNSCHMIWCIGYIDETLLLYSTFIANKCFDNEIFIKEWLLIDISQSFEKILNKILK